MCARISISRGTDPFQKMNQVRSQTFLPAEKYFVRVSEQVIESESVISHASTANFPQGVFSNIRNISLPIVDLVGHFLNKIVEPVVIEYQDLERCASHLQIAACHFPLAMK